MAEKKLTFEQSMERLDEIVSILEENERPLDETIALFEEGLKLVRSCDQKLKQFENRINDIIQKNGGDEDAD
ncbi:MAG: exodeoxyribonuclease VII small subunit [Solobacterium sp.]|nr:exodeoxyribonuclease VII small subunit [Solobacterium sp.]